MRERITRWCIWVAKAVVRELIDYRPLQQLIRHIVLSVVAEQEHQRDRQILDTFFEYCQSVGVEPKVEDGKLKFTNLNRIDEYLGKVIILYRQQIKDHVERMNDMESRAERNGHK